VNKIVLGSLSLCVWALGAVASGCAGSSEPAQSGGVSTPPDGDKPEGPTPDPSAQACQTADDCIVVEIACCDHCNGGKAEAFNKARADEYRPKNCEGTACTRRGCGNAVAVCSNNLCKVEIQPL
jgi:hypothetical protein